MPIFNQLIFNKYSHARPLFYGVLDRLSTDYPPVEGRLHTRYSPVRRSPPYCYVLPLDLHVLSLSLAFILSQDQTLHCKIVSFCPFAPKTLRKPVFIDGTIVYLYTSLKVIASSRRNRKSLPKKKSTRLSSQQCFLHLVLHLVSCKSLKERLLFCRKSASKDLFFLKSGCKGKGFFSIIQIFLLFFFKKNEKKI